MKRANLMELEKYGIIERHEVFARYHNFIMGHLVVVRTLKTMSLGGHSWARMRKTFKIGLASVAYARRLSINIQHTGRTKGSIISPLSYSLHTLGPLKEDENENCFIIVIVDNFSKLIGLYPARNTSKEYLGAGVNFWCT